MGEDIIANDPRLNGRLITAAELLELKAPVTYLLHLRKEQASFLDVGMRPKQFYAAGHYYYVGSARRASGHRLLRHWQGTGALHWHIDYLRRCTKPEGIYTYDAAELTECQLGSLLGQAGLDVIARFGASDCNCPGHLYYAAQPLDMKKLNAELYASDSLQSDNQIERMDAFFSSRLTEYDEHMLTEVEGLPAGYAELAKCIPPGSKTLLDLGCGTGLELEEVFKLHPDIQVTGIDINQHMLAVLAEKYTAKNISLICASYLDCDLGEALYDCAISCETMHHWTCEEKMGIYRSIYRSLKPDGMYIECDYMVAEQGEEDQMLAESSAIRAQHHIADGEMYHIDIPFTIENQISLLTRAGFSRVNMIWREGATTIITSTKVLR